MKRTIALCLMIITCLWLVITISKGEVPSLFGYKMFRVVTDSMSPVIPGSTCILVRTVDPLKLKVGDVITFRSQDPAIYGYFNTHRIYELVSDQDTGEILFITKGDANATPDDIPVSGSQIAGKYIAVIPFGHMIGRAIGYLSKANHYFIFIIGPLLICFLSYCFRFIHEIRTISQQETED